MSDEIPITEEETDPNIARKERFFDRYRDVTAERLPRVLLKDVLLLGESEQLDFDEYSWAVEYAENYINARN